MGAFDLVLTMGFGPVDEETGRRGYRLGRPTSREAGSGRCSWIERGGGGIERYGCGGGHGNKRERWDREGEKMGSLPALGLAGEWALGGRPNGEENCQGPAGLLSLSPTLFLISFYLPK